MSQEMTDVREIGVPTCCMCSDENRLGLRLPWRRVSEREVETTANLGAEHQGYPGLVHGGVLAAIADEAFGTAMLALHPNRLMVTSKLEVQYLKPVQVGSEVTVRAKILNDSRYLADAGCELRLADGSVAVSATARLARPVRSSSIYDVVSCRYG